MIKRNILSVPILLENGRYAGFLNMMDVVRYVVRHFGGPATFREGNDFWQLVREESKFEQQTVADLLQRVSTAPGRFVPVIAGYSAYNAVEVMARETGCRRVPVLNDRKDKRLINLVSARTRTAAHASGLSVRLSRLSCARFRLGRSRCLPSRSA